MANSTLINILKVWPIVQCIRRLDFLTGFHQKVYDKLKTNVSNASLIWLSNVLSVLLPIESKKLLKSWNLTPCVYDAYISGLIFATAVRYGGPQSSAIKASFAKLQALVAQASTSVGQSRTKVISVSLSIEITKLYEKISLDFIAIMGLSFKSSLIEVNNWVSHNSQFFGSEVSSLSESLPLLINPPTNQLQTDTYGRYNLRFSQDMAAYKQRLLADALLRRDRIAQNEGRVTNPHITVVRNSDESLTLIEDYTSSHDNIRILT